MARRHEQFARNNFRILEERPAEYTPLAALNAFIIKVNRLSSMIAKRESGGHTGQRLVAMTRDDLPHETAQTLMDGKPFIGVDGICYIIQK